MKQENIHKILFLIIFLSILIIAYPITYFLIETPYYSCSQYFPFLKNTITEYKDPELFECIKINRDDVEDIFSIFIFWFISFFIFFIVLNKIINFKALDYYFKKFTVSSDLIYYIIITLVPTIYSLSVILDVSKFNFLFLFNKSIFFFLLFYFYFANKKIFIVYFIISCFPILFGEISQSIYLFLTLFYLSIFRNLNYKNIIKNLLIFLTLFFMIIFSQDYFKKKYGYSSINKYKISFQEGEIKTSKDDVEKFHENYFDYQLKYNKRYIYFKFSNYIDNSYLNLLYNRTLRRLSEINHTAIVNKLIKTNNASFLNGKTYERLPVLLIPRIIYPNKPSETYGNILICEFGIGNQYTTKKECFEKNTSSINLNVLLEGFINYKYFGLFFSSFFIALFGAIIFNLTIKKEFYLNVLGVCVLYQSIMYQSNLSGVLGGIIIIGITVVPILFLRQINEKKI